MRVNKLKVSHFVSYYPKDSKEWFPAFGGIDSNVFNLTQSLSKLGVEITINTSQYPNYYPKTILNGKITVRRYRPLMIFLGFPIMPSLTLNCLKNNNIDIVHGHINSPLIVDSAALCKRIGKKPFVITYQADPFATDISTKYSFIGNLIYKPYLRILQSTLKHADKIIATTSLYAKNSIILSKFSEKIEIIPNGVNVNHFQPGTSSKMTRELLNLEKDTKVITFVGRLVRYKGIPYLLKAIPSILNQIKNCQFLIIGDGPLRRSLEEFTKKLKISDNVKFLGSIPNFNLPLIYSVSDIFVLPSISSSEGFGIVLIEAMSCEVPVIASNVGGIPNVIKNNETGLIIKPRNSFEIKNSIIKLLENEKLRKQMGKNARKHVLKNFSFDKTARSTLNLYENLLRK